MVTTAALMYEALKFCRDKATKALLDEHARRRGAAKELLDGVEQLVDGSHPAARFLGRARNKLGFHWDEKEVRASVREYGKNDALVWLERSGDDAVHRLASEVLAHALFQRPCPFRNQRKSKALCRKP